MAVKIGKWRGNRDGTGAAAEERRRARRDLVQNMVITLLFLSAAALFTQTQLYSLGIHKGAAALAGGGQTVSASAQTAVLVAPVRVAVTGTYGRFGSVTMTTGMEAFADPLGRRLSEALGSARSFVPCTEAEFMEALEGPSLYYDFLTALPLPVLGALVDGVEELDGTLSARRLVIAAQEDGTALYLWDGGGICCRALTAVSADSLTQTVSRYELGGAFFAQDREETAELLAPCSLLPEELPSLPVLIQGDPLADTGWLLSALSFNPRTRTRYLESNGTELITDGDRALRIRPDQSVYYQSGRDPILKISAQEETPTLREAAVGTGALLNTVLTPVSGAALPYLKSIRQNGAVTNLQFDYQVGGVPIRFSGGGCAAEVTLTGTTVTSLILRFRQYTASEEQSLLLPLPQALAVAARDPGRELTIGYVDGSDCAAHWLVD